jgi:hypothetical protein
MLASPARLPLKGRFHIEHFDKNGALKGEYEVDNGIVTEGMNKLLEVMFHGDTAVTTWYVGLINNTGFSALANTDVAAQISDDGSLTNGWREFTAYDEATRGEWTEGTAAARSITNAVTVDFTINASGTVKGIFIVSTNTKSGTTGVLWSTAAFGSNVIVNDDDVLKITYTLTG